MEIDGDVLQRIWAEMDYRFDVCPDTKGGHIQHLRGMPKKKKLGQFLRPSEGGMLNPLGHLSVQIF